MFLTNSRYYSLESVETIARDGRTVNAVKLRRLPAVTGNAVLVESNDRLDTLSQESYDDPTMFWHIGDANSELQVNDLVKEAGRTIAIPEQ